MDTSKFVQHRVNRFEFDLPTDAVTDSDAVPVMISLITHRELADVITDLTDQLNRRYREETANPPLHFSLLSDPERLAIHTAVNSILDGDPHTPFQPPYVVEQWLEREMAESPSDSLPEECWVRVLHYWEDYEPLSEISFATPLNRITGATPIAISAQNAARLQIGDLPSDSEVLLLQPIFTRLEPHI